MGISAATAEIGTLTDREVLIAGAIAHWCEGPKKKPYLSNERVVFINSDARLIRLSCGSLRLRVPHNRKNRSEDYHGCLRVSVHESACLYPRIEGRATVAMPAA